MALRFIDQIDLNEKKVVARFDFNVPLDKENPSKILDTTRIDLALKTIRYILENGAKKLVIMSHLGRPEGKREPKLSLEPVAKYLAEQLGEDVLLSESAIDRGIKTLLVLNESKIILLENLRFHPEETKNDQEFANILASYGDIYVNDAFGTAHRKHASTYQINHFFKGKAVGGFLLKSEIEALSKVVERPKTPFIAIVGGAKVSDKIKIIERLLGQVTKLIIGGAMAYPFLKAQGHSVGKSLCGDEDVSLAKKILNGSGKNKIVLPLDHIVSTAFDGDAETWGDIDIEKNKMGLDIGPHTIELYKSILVGSKTVLWNGPMGMFENKNFSKGTFTLATTLSELDAFTLVGGGDSVNALKVSGLSSKMSHVSTGGGASLEYIEKGSLPGIDALKFGVN